MDFIPIVLTIHVLIVLALIGVVLLQRSEGGALGIGGGGGGGFMSGRGAANVLTRSTSVLAAMFFATSLGLAIFADQGETEVEIIEDLTGTEITTEPGGDLDSESLIRSIGGGLTTTPQDAPAAPAVDDDPLSNVVDTLPEPLTETLDDAADTLPIDPEVAAGAVDSDEDVQSDDDQAAAVPAPTDAPSGDEEDPQ